MTLDPDSGKVISSYGKGLFLMPHGLTIDEEGNHYVTDVGLHQVMRVSWIHEIFAKKKKKKKKIPTILLNVTILPIYRYPKAKTNPTLYLAPGWNPEKTKHIFVCQLPLLSRLPVTFSLPTGIATAGLWSSTRRANSWRSLVSVLTSLASVANSGHQISNWRHWWFVFYRWKLASPT